MKRTLKEWGMTRRVLAFLLVAVMVVGYIPVSTKAEAETTPGTVTTVADPETLTRPETIYGNSTLNAGKVTVGKSVNKDSFSIEYAQGKNQTFSPATNNFIVTMSQTAQVMGLTSEMTVPVDVVFVLDTSGSMEDNNRDSNMVSAANSAIQTLMNSNPNNRVGVVAFSAKTNQKHNAAAEVLSSLAHYSGTAASSHLSLRSSTIYGQTNNESRTVTGGTNIQAGVALGAKMLLAADTTVDIGDGNIVTRIPFLIILSDGQPTFSLTTDTWYDESSINLVNENGSGNQPYPGNGFMAALTAAYYKGKITEHYYGTGASEENRCFVYSLGVQLNTLSGDNRDLAELTMNPTAYLNDTGNEYSDDFRSYWSDYSQNKEVTVTVNGRSTNYSKNPYTDTISVNTVQETKNYVNGISSAGKQMYAGGITYNDGYYNASSTSDIAGIFDTVISEINRKAISSPTHVTTGGDHNFEGYVTFTDPIGEYMEVKNIRGILANGHMHPGADFARLLKAGDSAFINSFKNVLKKRMSLTGVTATDDFLNDLIAKAKSSDYQANYVNPTDYDNSIVWWGSRYDVGQEDEGVQLLGHADNDTVEYIEKNKNSDGNVMVNGVKADYVCRSYFFHCTEDTSHEFMYLMVRIQRELTAPYKETVVVSIPASLLSVDEVLVNEKTSSGSTTYTADINDVYPLRVIYEVGLRSDINAQNVDSIVSDAYRAEKPADSESSVNYDPTSGTYYFFTNDWNRNESLNSHHRAMAKATFDAAADNSFYTYQEDTLLLDKNGNPYTGSLSPKLELYYEREFYTWSGSAVSGTTNTYEAEPDSQLIKVVIPDDYSTVIKQVDGKWYISKGVYTASTLEVTGDDKEKEPENVTKTSEIVSHAHRTGTSSNSHYTVLLGNNGMLSLVREPAKTVSVADANGDPKDGVADDNDDGETVMVGDVLTYTIKVSNADDAPVTAVVTDTVPKGTAYVPNSADVKDAGGNAVDGVSFAKTGDELKWSGISIGAKQAVYVTFQVQVTTDAISGANDVVNIDNTASIKLGTNPAYTTNKVTNPPEGKKVVNQAGNDIEGNVKVGDVLVYRIRVQSDAVDSNGTPIQSDIVVTDELPAGTTFKSASHGGVFKDGTVTWNFTKNGEADNRLAAGASVVVTFEVYVDASAKVTDTTNNLIEFKNDAEIKIGDNDPRVTNEVTTTATVGNISITKAFDEGVTGFDSKGFKLTLTESGYKLDGTYALTRMDAAGNTTDEQITFTGGVARNVSIKKGEIIAIKGIPVGATIMVAETLDPNTADKGWTVQSVSNSGSVTVSAETGKTDSADHIDVTVTNEYTPAPVTFVLGGTKYVDSTNFPDGVFAFNAKQVGFDEESNTLDENLSNPSTNSANVTVSGDKTNLVSGKDGAVFTFTPRVFTEADKGTRYYLITEADTTIKGVTTDGTKYLLKLVIGDDQIGNVTVTSYIQSNKNADGSARAWGEFSPFDWVSNGVNNSSEIKFTNTYTPTSISVTLAGNKSMTGRTMKDGEFSFQLVRRDGNQTGVVVATANNNNVNGEFAFEPLTFTEADMVDGEGKYVNTKLFQYAIREAEGPDANVSYDDTYYSVDITVTDNGGALVAETSVQKWKYENGTYVKDGSAVKTTGSNVGGIDYVNTYHTQDVSVSLSGTKILSGDAAMGLKPDDFTFEVVETDGNWNVKDPKKIVSTGANEVGTEKKVDNKTEYHAAVSFADITYGVSIFNGVDPKANGIKTLDFYYIAKEVIPGENEPSFDVNMKYAPEEYKIQVQVKLDTTTGIMTAQIVDVIEPDGIVATISETKDSVSGLKFNNIKNPDKVYFAPEGKKTTTSDKEIKDVLRFSFRVTDLDGNIVGTGLSRFEKNGVAEIIDFTTMEYNHEDVGHTYLYVIEEVAAANSEQIEYDTDKYVVAVTVGRNENNALKCTEAYYQYDATKLDTLKPYVENNTLTPEMLSGLVSASMEFSNKFNVEKTLNVTAYKQLTGDRKLNARDFDFRLRMLTKNTDGTFSTANGIVDGTNGSGNADNKGVVTFGTLLFTTDQVSSGEVVGQTSETIDDVVITTTTYRYYVLMNEIEPTGVKLAGVEYSKAEYIVAIDWDVKTSGTTPEYLDPEVFAVYEASYDKNSDRYSYDPNGTNLKGEGNDLGVTFENTYTPQQGTTVTLTATKKLTGAARELKDDDFSFELYRYYKDDQGQVQKTLVETATNKNSVNAENNRTGEITFTRIYPATIDINKYFVEEDGKQIATFIYQMKELPGSIPGIDYSEADYWVEVKIRHDQSTASLSVESVKYYADCDQTKLELSNEIAAENAVFTNTYVVKATSFEPGVTKILKTWSTTANDWVTVDLSAYDKAFSFELVEVDENGAVKYTNDAGEDAKQGDPGAYAKVIATANNDTYGVVKFAPIPYTAKGTHYYMIREVQGTDPGITYNQGNKVIYIKVVVNDNESNLTPSVEYGSALSAGTITPAADLTFTNYYGSYELNLDLDLKKQVSIPAGSTYQLKENEFDFNVYESDAAGTKGDYVTSGTNDKPEDGKNEAHITFGTIQITQKDFNDAPKDNNGDALFYFLIEEQKSGIPGITEDAPIVVTVTVADKGHGNLVQTSISYEQSDHLAGSGTDNVFVNIYNAEPAKLNLVANKTLIGKKLETGEFHYILSIDGKELKSDIAVDENGLIALPEIVLPAPGTFTYTFREVNGGDSRYTYDPAIYTITVNVTDDGKGQLHAVANIYKNYVDNGNNEPVGGMSFVNTYAPAGIEKELSTQIGAKKSIVDVNGDKLDNKPLSGFSFEVTDANGNPVKDKAGNVITGTSDNAGNIVFSSKFYFAAEGEYHYYISEVKGTKPGYEYDTNVWALHILVRYDNVKGDLYINDEDVVCALKATAVQQDESGAVAQSNAEPVFVNVYKPADTSIHLIAKKTLEGRAMRDGEFNFHLMRKDSSGAYSIIVSETENDANGNVNFHITYKLSDLVDETGKRVSERTFHYQIHEHIPDEAVGGVLNGVTFDNGKEDIVVTVKDEAGQINAYIGDQKITSTQIGKSFKNTYSAKSVDVPISATKVLTGGDLGMLKFSFELVNSAGEVVQTVSNGTDGLVTFAPLTFTKADLAGETKKEFVYTLREKTGTLAAVTYDTTTYTVTVTVTDNLMGKLQYAVHYSLDGVLTNPVFNNTYDSATNDTFATIQAKKTLVGKNLTADAFTFELEDKDGNILEAKNDSKGNVNFTVPYTAAGTYSYTLREKKGSDTAMEYDLTEYKVDVAVTAGDDGRLNAVVTYQTEEGEIPEFENVYTPTAVKVTLTGTKTLTGRDMTAGEFEFQVKDSNGKEVATGTNTADGKITFKDIVYTEPGQHLLTVTEVDSKADNVTYDSTAFKVGVNVTNVDGVLKAEVTYEKDIKFTNVYTPDPTEVPTEKPTEAPTEAPTNPSKPKPDVPGTGDNTRLDIPIVILVLSVIGILVVLVLMKTSNKGKYRK